MSVSIELEQITPDLCDEIDTYLEEQYDHSVASTDIPRYDHDWMTYRDLQAMGLLVVVVARIDGSLAGYTMYTLTPMLHHKSINIAICDGVVTCMQHRGKGIGRKLVEFAMAECKRRGANRIVNHYRVCYDTEPLFPKLGFKLIEHVYMKEL